MAKTTAEAAGIEVGIGSIWRAQVAVKRMLDSAAQVVVVLIVHSCDGCEDS